MAARRHAAWGVLVAIISLGAGLAPCTALAQSTLATVSGNITDPSGGALPGATITLTNAATGAERTAVASTTGDFNLPNVDAGVYVMVVRLQGFADASRNVELLARQVVRADTQLQLASTSEKIEVTAVRPVIERERATIDSGRRRLRQCLLHAAPPVRQHVPLSAAVRPRPPLRQRNQPRA